MEAAHRADLDAMAAELEESIAKAQSLESDLTSAQAALADAERDREHAEQANALDRDLFSVKVHSFQEQLVAKSEALADLNGSLDGTKADHANTQAQLTAAHRIIEKLEGERSLTATALHETRQELVASEQIRVELQRDLDGCRERAEKAEFELRRASAQTDKPWKRQRGRTQRHPTRR